MSLNDLWTRIKIAQGLIEKLNEDWEKLNANESYTPTLISPYDFERAKEDAKKTLIKKAIRLTFEKYKVNNVTVSEQHISALMKAEFRAQSIESFLKTVYIESADSKALSEILKEAKRLTPYLGYEKKVTVNDLVKKNKLKLRLFWSYESISFNSIEELRALEKLIDITVNGTKASKIKINPNANIAQVVSSFRGSYSEPFKEARSYVYDTPILEGFRIYKNGKIKITFKKAEDALKVAKVLCNNA